MLETIITAILAAAPALTAIIGIIAAMVRLINAGKDNSKEITGKFAEAMTTFEKVRQEVLDTKEYEELKSQLLIAHQENRELKKKINELLTKIDHIKREEE